MHPFVAVGTGALNPILQSIGVASGTAVPVLVGPLFGP